MGETLSSDRRRIYWELPTPNKSKMSNVTAKWVSNWIIIHLLKLELTITCSSPWTGYRNRALWDLGALGRFHEACFDHNWPRLVYSEEDFFDCSSSILYEWLRRIAEVACFGTTTSGKVFSNPVADLFLTVDLSVRISTASLDNARFFSILRFWKQNATTIIRIAITITEGGYSTAEGISNLKVKVIWKPDKREVASAIAFRGTVRMWLKCLASFLRRRWLLMKSRWRDGNMSRKKRKNNGKFFLLVRITSRPSPSLPCPLGPFCMLSPVSLSFTSLPSLPFPAPLPSTTRNYWEPSQAFLQQGAEDK